MTAFLRIRETLSVFLLIHPGIGLDCKKLPDEQKHGAVIERQTAVCRNKQASYASGYVRFLAFGFGHRAMAAWSEGIKFTVALQAALSRTGE